MQELIIIRIEKDGKIIGAITAEEIEIAANQLTGEKKYKITEIIYAIGKPSGTRECGVIKHDREESNIHNQLRDSKSLALKMLEKITGK